MNDTINTIMQRYSCRAYTAQPVSDEQIDALVKAALAAPSAMNNQNWKIIVATNPELLEDMENEAMGFLAAQEDKSTYNRFMDRGGAVMYHAPCWIFITIKPGTHLDCGILTENIALAAQSMGLGNVICGMAGCAFTKAKGDEFKKRLGFADGYELGMTVLVGHPKGEGKPHELDMGKVSYVK